MSEFIRAMPFIATPFIGAFFGQRITDNNMTWYRTLQRPCFTPPEWVFPPVWTALYGSMGLASYLVWRDASKDEALLPLAVYGTQLLLNWSWTPVFFGKHKIVASAGIIIGTLGSVAACVFLFRPINEVASNLMIPYAAWLTLAAAINIRVAMLN